MLPAPDLSLAAMGTRVEAVCVGFLVATGSFGLRRADFYGCADDPLQERVGHRVGQMLDQVARHLGHGRQTVLRKPS